MHKDQFSSLSYNPVKDRGQRPQTPLANSNTPSYNKFNQSYTKNHNAYSPHQFIHPHNDINNRNPNISKSRISVASSNSQLSFLNADQGEIFPEDLIFLLKNEDKNINNFKQKIEKQKNRVQNDFAVFKTEILHVLEDLKLSVQAELDLVYKVFISKYAEVKGEVQQIRRLRKQILIANQVGFNHTKPNKDTTSNFDLMNEIEKDAEHFRNYRVYGYLSEMQKQKINPILQLCNQLILLGALDSPFYRSKQMSLKHRQVKGIFTESLVDIYQRLKDFVITPAAIVQKQKQQQENTNNILKNLELQNQVNQFRQQKQAFHPTYPENRPDVILDGSDFSRKKQVSSIPTKKAPILHVGRSQKNLITKWAESLTLKKLQRITTDHADSILCIFFIDNRLIATGSKDKTIHIYTIDGQKVNTLRGHDASICCLSTIQSKSQSFLASGSDHGCCCLILWDVKTWNISSRIQIHGAAVTSIVDLEDNEHLVTGSYDKKISLYNFSKGQVTSTHTTKSAITSIALLSDKQSLVSSGLDFSLTLWKIVKKANGVSLQIGKAISNNSLICVLQPSQIRPQVVYGATRDGKIKMFNVQSQSELEKVFTVNQNSVIELVVIERQMKVDSPLILACSSKDKSLSLLKMDSGATQIVKVPGTINIEFGHGIGPKIVVSNSGIMAILSQSQNARQFSLYQVQLR